MSVESSQARPRSDLPGDIRQTQPPRRHKRTASLLCDPIDSQIRHVRNVNSFDSTPTLRSQPANPGIFTNIQIDDRYFQQTEFTDKVQIIETIEPDYCVTSGVVPLTFYPLYNKLGVGGWEGSAYAPMRWGISHKQSTKDRLFKPASPGNYLCSIQEQSELASSHINSIHKYSNSEMQKMLSTHGFRGEDGEAETSSRCSRQISSARIGSGGCPYTHNETGHLGSMGGVESPKTDVQPSLPTSKEAFRKNGPTDIPLCGFGESKVRKIPRSELVKKTSARPSNVQKRLDGSARKVPRMKADVKESRGTVGIDLVKPFPRTSLNPGDSDRGDHSQGPFDRPRPLVTGFSGKIPSETRQQPRPFNFRENPKVQSSALAPGSPPSEALALSKEPQGFFSTLLKKDWRQKRPKGDALTHLVKTVKSDERPDVIQRLFKFRVETDKILSKKDGFIPQKEHKTNFKQKIKTLLNLPDGDRLPKLSKPFPSALVKPPSVRRLGHIDAPFKWSFFNRLDRPSPAQPAPRPVNDRNSRSSCDNQSFVRLQTPQGSRPRRELFKMSVGVPGNPGSTQYRIKTETEVSYNNRLVFNSAQRLPAKYLRPFNADTKTKNLNIRLPLDHQSSDESVCDHRESVVRQAPADGPTARAGVERVGQSACKRPVNRLLGKARSLSLACLSQGGKSSHKNQVCGVSIHIWPEKRKFVSRGMPRIDIRRLGIVSSQSRKCGEIRLEVNRPLEFREPKDPSCRPFRMLSDDVSLGRRKFGNF